MPPNPKKADFTLLILASAAILFSVWYLSTHPLPKLVEEVGAADLQFATSTPDPIMERLTFDPEWEKRKKQHFDELLRKYTLRKSYKMYVVKNILEEVTVTGYNSVPGQTDNRPCEAADGSDICALEAQGDKSCASNIFGFGTRLYVSELGLCTVRDRMASRFSRRVDWFFGGHDQVQAARNWGKKRLKIFVLE